MAEHYSRRIKSHWTNWFSAVFFTSVTEYITYKLVEHNCSEQLFLTRSMCLHELIIIRLTFIVGQSVNVLIKDTSTATVTISNIYFLPAVVRLVELIRTEPSRATWTDLRSSTLTLHIVSFQCTLETSCLLYGWKSYITVEKNLVKTHRWFRALGHLYFTSKGQQTDLWPLDVSKVPWRV